MLKLVFFRAFNALYSKVGRLASEEVVISLLRSKCLPILFYATEACPLLVRTKNSLEFSITRIFMKLFRTGSPLIVKDCQRFFNFLPVKLQLVSRTANFLRKFSASENSMCVLFSTHATTQLCETFIEFNVNSVHQLHNAIHDRFYSD